MSTDTSYQWRKQLMWGLVLIGFGVAFLLDRMGMFDISELWHYWPLLLLVIGINKMIGYPTAKDFTSGLWTTFIGLWLFAVFDNMFGLTWRNAWPIPIIFAGVVMIIEPFITRRLAPNAELQNGK